MPLRDNYRLDRMIIEAPHPRPTLREARQASEALLKRAALLAPADRALVELAVGSSASQRQLATVLRMDAGTVTRRLKRLLGRLYDPLVLSCSTRTTLCRRSIASLGSSTCFKA
jgi:DNA-directed RNA polymerase specialized sigma24 family protein